MVVQVVINKKTHIPDYGFKADGGQIIIMTKCGFAFTTGRKKDYNTGRYKERRKNLPVAKLQYATCPRCIRYDNVYLRLPRLLKYVAYRTWDMLRKAYKRLT